MVRKQIAKITITIILLSMGCYLGVLFTPTNEIQEAIIIQGKNDNWQIEEFKVIKYESKIQWGDGRIEYLGDPKDLDDLTSFEFKIIKEPIDQKGRSEVLYYNSIKTTKGFSIGGETAAVTFGQVENDKHRTIHIENYESNISGKEDYTFDENYIIKAKVYLRYTDKKEIEDEISLGMVIMNKETFNKVHAKVEKNK